MGETAIQSQQLKLEIRGECTHNLSDSSNNVISDTTVRRDIKAWNPWLKSPRNVRYIEDIKDLHSHIRDLLNISNLRS
jgi:hypothetical protein